MTQMTQNSSASAATREESNESSARLIETASNSDAETKADLDRLESELIDMLAEHHDEALFWTAFNGRAEAIRSAAPDELEFIDARVAAMLAGLGLVVPEAAP